MKFAIFLGTFAVLAAGVFWTPSCGEVGCPPLPAAEVPAWKGRIDAIIDAAVADGFAGQVAILRGGKIAYSRAAGFSDGAGRIPVTGETLFHVASISKYLTAILVLEAAEEGKLALDDSIGLHLPSMKLAARGVTIRDLLAHRSGLGTSYAAETITDPAAALAAIDAAPFDAGKAGAFRYSNDGYDLLAIVLERTYGALYEAIARAKVLDPACLRNAGFWGDVDLTDPRLVGQPLRTPPENLRKRNYGMLGSAGFLVTAPDLARLQAAVDDGTLLAGSSVAELDAPRGTVSIGEATFGAFRLHHEKLGPFVSARGFEDWGDNAILNHYTDHDLIVAVVTSKGPAEGSGEPFRNRISKAIEEVLETTVEER